MTTMKDAREKIGFTQLDMAKRLNLHEQNYQAYERYKNKPNVLLAQRIAQILGVDIEDIFKPEYYK